MILKHKINNSIHVNMKNFIKYIKLNVILYNEKTLKDKKKKFLNKYYKFHYI